MRKEWRPDDVPTVQKFMHSDKFLRYLQGPFGSGKSVGCVQEIVKRAAMQAGVKEHDGTVRRKTRWAVIRNTYRQLQDTTIKTFLDWYQDRVWGIYKVADTEFLLKFQLEDKSIVEAEVMFRALDRPDQVGNLLSLELTGAWCNEAREMPKEIWDALQGRVGRYPSRAEGGATWYGIFADSNPPDDDHWLYKTFVVDRPDNAEAFYQPSGLSDRAENIPNLPKNYYVNMAKGKDPEYIKVYIEGQYGFIRDGKAVYPQYNDQVHCSEEIIAFDDRFDIYRGWDFGRTPACLISQLINGRIICIDELVSEGTGIEGFAKDVLAYCSHNFPNHVVGGDFGDPSGGFGTQVDEQTAFTKLWDMNVNIVPAYSNDPEIRIDAVKSQLNTMVNGKPALYLSPKCDTFRKGFKGGYAYKRINVGGERYQDKPDKNKFSHIHDAGQYLIMQLTGGYSATPKPPRVLGISARGI